MTEAGQRAKTDECFSGCCASRRSVREKTRAGLPLGEILFIVLGATAALFENVHYTIKIHMYQFFLKDKLQIEAHRTIFLSDTPRTSVFSLHRVPCHE